MQFLKKLIILNLSILVIAGCSNHPYADTNKLFQGMSKQQVVAAVGLPYKKESEDKKEIYYYQNTKVCFDQNGKVNKVGFRCFF